jgi:hypothetical protein
VTPFGPGLGVRLYGSEGALEYDFLTERIRGGQLSGPNRVEELEEILVPAESARDWRVEADFVEAIRGGQAIEFTDFPRGVAYMEFTEAVARSAQVGEPVELVADGDGK